MFSSPRALPIGPAESWGLRDTHMFETLELLFQAKGPNAKAVVGGHNSHFGAPDHSLLATSESLAQRHSAVGRRVAAPRGEPAIALARSPRTQDRPGRDSRSPRESSRSDFRGHRCSRSRSLGATGSDLIAFEHSFDFCDRTLRIVLVDFRDEAASRFGTKVPAHDAERAWRGNQDTGHIIL